VTGFALGSSLVTGTSSRSVIAVAVGPVGLTRGAMIASVPAAMMLSRTVFAVALLARAVLLGTVVAITRPLIGRAALAVLRVIPLRAI
jgi:hypothetical protein